MDVFVGNKKYNFSRITDFYLFLKSEKNNINSIIVDKDTDEDIVHGHCKRQKGSGQHRRHDQR